MDSNKTTSRKERANETKRKIYESAEELFLKYGYEKVSVDSIIEKAGVAKGSFYVHFESKNYLLAELIATKIKKLDTSYKPYLDTLLTDHKASQILLILAEKVVDILINSVGYEEMRRVYEILITRNSAASSVLDYQRDLYKAFELVIRKGVEEGEFRTDLPIEVLVKNCIQAIRGYTFEWCVRYPDYNFKENVLQHFEFLLNGIKESL